jgi:hypothetical protein
MHLMLLQKPIEPAPHRLPNLPKCIRVKGWCSASSHLVPRTKISEDRIHDTSVTRWLVVEVAAEACNGIKVRARNQVGE